MTYSLLLATEAAKMGSWSISHCLTTWLYTLQQEFLCLKQHKRSGYHLQGTVKLKNPAISYNVPTKQVF